jgi:hypothetical protein
VSEGFWPDEPRWEGRDRCSRTTANAKHRNALGLGGLFLS